MDSLTPHIQPAYTGKDLRGVPFVVGVIALGLLAILCLWAAIYALQQRRRACCTSLHCCTACTARATAGDGLREELCPAEEKLPV